MAGVASRPRSKRPVAKGFKEGVIFVVSIFSGFSQRGNVLIPHGFGVREVQFKKVALLA
jgi:hypothetical protein